MPCKRKGSWYVFTEISDTGKSRQIEAWYKDKLEETQIKRLVRLSAEFWKKEIFQSWNLPKPETLNWPLVRLIYNLPIPFRSKLFSLEVNPVKRGWRLQALQLWFLLVFSPNEWHLEFYTETVVFGFPLSSRLSESRSGKKLCINGFTGEPGGGGK